MRRMPFERPSDHYDERVKEIDEKLCKLIRERNETSGGDPGFPPFEYIAGWAEKFDLYEDFLKSFFGTLYAQKQYRPMVEPHGFRMNLPVLKAVEAGDRLFSITFIRQYINSSVVNVNIDWEPGNDMQGSQVHRSHYELSIGPQYDCRFIRGEGSEGHYSNSFVVSPPLPDNLAGLELVFKEYTRPFNGRQTGGEIVIRPD